MALAIGERKISSLHLAGILGSGMSAIAQYLAWSGCAVSGSDRVSSAEELKDSRKKLERCGCRIFPHCPQVHTGSGAVDVIPYHRR